VGSVERGGAPVLGEAAVVADAETEPPAVDDEGGAVAARGEQLVLVWAAQVLLVVAGVHLAGGVDHQCRARQPAVVVAQRSPDDDDDLVCGCRFPQRIQACVRSGHRRAVRVGAQRGWVVGGQEQLRQHG
jgi:hypothetical protein